MPFPIFPPNDLHYFPRMSAYDTPIWRDFLAEYKQNYTGFSYDVQVGIGSDPEPDIEQHNQTLWRTLTKKRIDAIGYRTGFNDIFEVKPIADASTIGQILVYEALYVETFRPTVPTNKIVVCRSVKPDSVDSFAIQGIKLIILPPKEPPI